MTVISVDDSVLFHAELWDLHKLAGNSLVAHPRKLTRLFRMQTACYSGMVSAITSSCSKDWSIYFVLSKQQRTDCGTCSLPEGTGPHVRQFIRAKFKFFVDRLKMSTKLVCFSQSRYALTQQYKKISACMLRLWFFQEELLTSCHVDSTIWTTAACQNGFGYFI